MDIIFMCKLPLLILLSYFLNFYEANVHYVHPSFCSNYTGCLTFSDYANDTDRYFTSNTMFVFLNGIHHLNVSLALTNVFNMSLLGESSGALNLTGKGIIAWYNSTKIVIHNLHIYHCGFSKSMTKSALQFHYSSQIELSNVSFYKFDAKASFSRGVYLLVSSILFRWSIFEGGYSCNGGAIFLNTSTVIFLGNNYFTNNSVNVSSGYNCNGGAIYLNISTANFLGNNYFTNNSANATGGAVFSLRSILSFNGSTSFAQNCATEGGAIIAIYSDLNFNCNKSCSNESKNNDTEKLNGSYPFMHSNSNTISTTYSFIANRGSLGGAISLKRSNSSFNCKTIFRNNMADRLGGAINAIGASIFMVQTTIAANSAKSGGAGIYAYFSNIIMKENISVLEGFTKYDGGGIHMINSILRIDCQILTISYNRAQQGGGAYLYNSKMIVSGTVYFLNNLADNGGGLFFEYSDIYRTQSNNISLTAPLDLHFYGNNAIGKGGALYVQNGPVRYFCDTIRYHYPCFFQINVLTLSLSDIRLNFNNNSANEGEILFGGSLEYCLLSYYRSDYVNLPAISNTDFTAYNSYRSTRPFMVCPCHRGTPNCSLSLELSLYRGQELDISLATIGEFMDIIPVRLEAEYDEHNSTSVSVNPKKTQKKCTNVKLRVYSEQDVVNLDLKIRNCDYKSTKVLIALTHCPPGFIQSKSYCLCDQNLINLANGRNICNVATGLIEYPGRHWIQSIFSEDNNYTGLMWGLNCPEMFCRKEFMWLNLSLINNSDSQCQAGRTGIMCGACKSSYSLILNTLNCGKCQNSNNTAFIVVFLLAGVLLIAILLLLHSTVFLGKINGLILYANIISICRDIFIPAHKSTINPLTLFIAWMNLDFGISTCFYNGMDMYSYMWLQYLFPFYLWLLIGIIILVTKFSSRAVRLLGTNPISVLATIILMSYTKLLQTSQAVLSYVTVNNSINYMVEYRWKKDPNVLFFQGKHIYLALFSGSVIAFLIAPFILLLTFSYPFLRFSGRKEFHWLNKLKPLFDAYYAPYHKNMRYWTGFLLIIRLIICVNYSVSINNESNIILITITCLLSVAAIMPWLTTKIYERKINNILEISMIFNLIILSIVTYYSNIHGSNNLQITYISTSIVFVQFIAIFLYHLLHKFGAEYFLSLLRSLITKIKNWLFPKSAHSLLSNERRNTIQVTTTTIDLREPLVECSEVLL